MQKIDISKLDKTGIDSIVRWYNQPDKSWLYCDCPINLDYSSIEEGLKYVLGLPHNDSQKINYYLIELEFRKIGFALVRQSFDFFADFKGFSVGLDIPESDKRNRGYGSIALRKLLLKFKKDRPEENKIYLETLSYNTPMRSLAERMGFQRIDCKELGTEYQEGFNEHIDDISRCLSITREELLKEKVYALLYELDLTDWPNVELREISELDKGLFDEVELTSDYVDLSSYDYKTDEKTVSYALYDKNTLIGGIKTEYNTDDKSCEISDFFIADKYQEYGYGKSALNKIIKYIKSNCRFKIEKVKLEVCTSNTRALNLYWITGFRPIDYDCFWGKWTMELLIDSHR